MTDKFLKSLKLNKNTYKIPSKLSDLDIDMEIGGGSWNELKDKPFYERVVVTEILPEQQITTTNFTSFPFMDIKLGETYTVIWNGVEYEKTPKREYWGKRGDGEFIYGYFIGNLSKIDAIYEDTGEPFLICGFDEETASMMMFNGEIISYDGVPNTVSIEKREYQLKQIDSKFIDDDPLIIKVNSDNTYDKTRQEMYEAYVSGKRLILQYGLMYYDLVGVKLRSDTPSSSIFYFGVFGTTMTGDTSLTLTLYEIGSAYIEKLSYKLVTDKYKFDFSDIEIPPQVQGDWEQNDTEAVDYIKNRTHYVESINFTELLNKTLEFTEGVYIGTEEINLEVGKQYIVRLSQDGYTFETEELTAFPLEEDGVTLGIGMLSDTIGVQVLSVYPEFSEMIGGTFAVMCGTNGAVETTILYGEEVVKTLEPKYLPDLSLGIHDGRLHLFVDGKPVGDGFLFPV